LFEDRPCGSVGVPGQLTVLWLWVEQIVQSYFGNFFELSTNSFFF
jgi:hypothetical protein